MRRAPLTWFFVAAILLAFLYEMRTAARFGATGFAVLGETTNKVLLIESGAAYGGMDVRTEGWRLFASIFLHAGVLHLAVNLIALVSIGELLEGLFGAPVMLLSFLGGGVLASVAMLLLTNEEGVVYLGASGAIFSIAGTLIVGLRKVWRRERARWSRRLSSRLGGCLAFNLGLGLVVSAIAIWAGLSFAIANSAHIAGLIAGAIIGLLPLRMRQNEVTARIMRIFDPPPPDPPRGPAQPFEG